MQKEFIHNLPLFIAGLVLASCVSTGAAWKRAGISAEQFAVDKETCRSRALREAEETYRDNRKYNSAGGVNNGTKYNTLMRQHDARRDTRKIFERCLSSFGYKKINVKAANNNI